MVTWLYIFGGIVAFLLCWCLGTLGDSYPRAWEHILMAVVVGGGLWLALEGDYLTLRTAFFLPFVLAFAMWQFWQK
jgi:hypothetical protein